MVFELFSYLFILFFYLENKYLIIIYDVLGVGDIVVNKIEFLLLWKVYCIGEREITNELIGKYMVRYMLLSVE